MCRRSEAVSTSIQQADQPPLAPEVRFSGPGKPTCWGLCRLARGMAAGHPDHAGRVVSDVLVIEVAPEGR